MELKRIEEFFDLLSIKRTRTNGDENELKRIQELLEENNEELVADSSDNTLDLANAKHPENGQTPLMYVAMETGDSRVVQVLLEFGAKWNECDEDGHCAGEYAARAGFNELAMMLMDYGVECELELSRMEREKGGYVTDTSYLKEKIVYDGEDRLLDQQGDAVMMKWETPLMKIHAERICEKCGRDAVVMNVGFGLGIVDGFIQDLEPKKHVIIEAHPDVYQHMIRKGWDKKENVDIRFGRWQDVIDDIANEYEFTGIFFDTYGESYDEIREFHEHLPN
jgi:type IV protein arginine methyltransferase